MLAVAKFTVCFFCYIFVPAIIPVFLTSLFFFLCTSSDTLMDLEIVFAA